MLAEQGCYADFTLPAAPDPCQTRTINQIYYASSTAGQRKSHDRGVRVRVGGRTEGDLMIIQGPLGFMWSMPKFGLLPRIENSDVRTSSPPTPARIDAWVRHGDPCAGAAGMDFRQGPHARHAGAGHGHAARANRCAAHSSICSPATTTACSGSCTTSVRARPTTSSRPRKPVAAANPGQYRDFVVPRPGFEDLPSPQFRSPANRWDELPCSTAALVIVCFGLVLYSYLVYPMFCRSGRRWPGCRLTSGMSPGRGIDGRGPRTPCRRSRS